MTGWVTRLHANRSAEVTALQSKMGAVLDLLRKLVPVAPADMRDELEGLLTPPAPAEAVQQVNPPAAQPSIAPAPGTGDTDAEGRSIMLRDLSASPPRSKPTLG